MITKEQIFESLKGKYAKNSPLDERTISETLEPLMKFVTEETSLEDFLETVEPIFKSVEGNIRKINSDTAKEIEKKYAKPEEKKQDKEEEPPKDDTPEWAKALIEEQKTIKEKLAERERLGQAEQVRKTVLEKAKIYPQNVIDAALDGFDFSQEGAESKFIEKAGRTAGYFGIKPAKGEPKEDEPKFSELRKKIDNEKNY